MMSSAELNTSGSREFRRLTGREEGFIRAFNSICYAMSAECNWRGLRSHEKS